MGNLSLKRTVFWMLALGVTWRILRWGLGMPLWGDEVMLALNILDRSVIELFQPLEMGQVAPPMFLVLNSLILDITGYSEWPLRFTALIFGIVGLLLFSRFALSVVKPKEALVSISVLAVSYYVVRYGSEFKPYSLDLTVVVCLFASAQYFRCHPVSILPACVLIFVVGVSAFFSYASLFVSVSILIVLSVESMTRKELHRLLVLGITGLLFLVLFAVNYKYIIAPQQQSASAIFLREYWSAAFAPTNFVDFIQWLIRMSAGSLMAYPNGGEKFGSILTLGLFCIGITVLVRRKDWFLLWVLLLPFALNILASFFHLYPYGLSARIAQHLAPSICLLMGIGLVFLLGVTRGINQNSGIKWAIILLSIFGFAGITEVIINPYKSKSDLQVRSLVQDQFSQLGCLQHRVVNSPETVPVTFLWYLSIRENTLFGRHALNYDERAADPLCIWHFPAVDSRLEDATNRAILNAYVDKYPDVSAAFALTASSKSEFGLRHWESQGSMEGRSMGAALMAGKNQGPTFFSWLEERKDDMTVLVDQTGAAYLYGSKEARRVDLPSDHKFRFIMLERRTTDS